MNRSTVLSCCVLLSLLPTFGASAQPSPPPAPARLDAVVVSGESPGPGMWRMTAPDGSGNVLWIIGSHTPLPTKMRWRTKDVEAAISQAQEVLEPPRFTLSMKQVGFFNALTMVPMAMEGRKNPDGKRLSELVPADVYARWLVLRDRYIDNTSTDEGDIELYRPIFAALELYQKAITKSGLSASNQVLATVTSLAKKHRVKMSKVEFEPKIDNVRGIVREFKKTQMADLDCFTKTIERIETDLSAMRVRANAWSMGDVAKLRSMSFTDQRSACEAAVRNSSFMKSLQNVDFEKSLNEVWMQAATDAIKRNKVTVGVVTMDRLLSKGGLLEQFAARGYKIEAPDELAQ